jgi:hypothetical protein
MRPTLFPTAGKLHQQALKAFTVYITGSGRLIFKDHITKQR